MSQPKLLRRDIKPVENSIALLNSDALYNKFDTFLTSDNLSIKGGGAEASLSNIVNVTNNYINNIYPIGSVYVTSTNSNPASYLGGTWTLFNKKFKRQTINASASTFTMSNTTNCSDIPTGWFSFFDDVIRARINFVPKVALTDSTLDMFTINVNAIGCSALATSQFYSFMSDGGQVVFSYHISSAGVFGIRDIIQRNNTAANLPTGFTIETVSDLVVDWSKKIDSFCDRFYWRRTA